MPHISLAMQNDGDVCVCNINTASFKHNKTHETIYIHKEGLQSAWNSYTRKIISTALDKGIRLPSCQACWDHEDAGAVSARQRHNEAFKDVVPNKDQPRILIIKPGNICNLGCRMCNPATSTSLYNDFYKLETEQKSFEGSFKEYTNNFEIIRESFSKNNNGIWDTLNHWAHDLHFIDIYGGEPMLSPEIWNTLKHAVDQNVSQSISIQYHTNCTIWNDRYIDLLQHFKSVNIGLSIDSNDPTQLEYIRHKSNYQEVISILKKYVDLKNKFNNINPFITVTVSIYNIYYLDKIIDGLKTFGLPVKLNFVHSPSHYDIRHLPVPIKKHLIEKFSNENKLNNVISLLEQTIPGCDIEWPKWRREVHMLDKIRNQSFQETFPDWYSIIKQFPN